MLKRHACCEAIHIISNLTSAVVAIALTVVNPKSRGPMLLIIQLLVVVKSEDPTAVSTFCVSNSGIEFIDQIGTAFLLHAGGAHQATAWVYIVNK